MLDGLLAHAPGAEACYHDAVGAPERGCVRVVGQIQAVAFWQLR